MRGFYDRYFSEGTKEKTIDSLNCLSDIAKELGCTQAQLVLAWVIKWEKCQNAIFGASREEQVHDNVQAVKIMDKLTPEILKRINEK